MLSTKVPAPNVTPPIVIELVLTVLMTGGGGGVTVFNVPRWMCTVPPMWMV